MKAMRGPVRGAASAEWLVVAPAVLAVGFGILQWAVLMHGRSSVEYAAFEGARAGATAHADPGAIVEGIATGLVAIRGTEITSIPVSASRAGAAALFRQELADGVAIWRQLRPRTEDFVDAVDKATDGRGADVILDMVGGDYLARNLNALAVNGRIGCIANRSGDRSTFAIGALMRKRGHIFAATIRSRPLAERQEIIAGVREHVWPLVEAGTVKPVIDSVFDLADATAAHQRMESSAHIGKILLRP